MQLALAQPSHSRFRGNFYLSNWSSPKLALVMPKKQLRFDNLFLNLYLGIIFLRKDFSHSTLFLRRLSCLSQTITQRPLNPISLMRLCP